MELPWIGATRGLERGGRGGHDGRGEAVMSEEIKPLTFDEMRPLHALARQVPDVPHCSVNIQTDVFRRLVITAEKWIEERMEVCNESLQGH